MRLAIQLSVNCRSEPTSSRSQVMVCRTVVILACPSSGFAAASTPRPSPAVPTSQGHDAADAYPASQTAASHTAAGHARRLVVAFVAGQTGTVASDLLAPYDIFASSPVFRA